MKQKYFLFKRALLSLFFFTAMVASVRAQDMTSTPLTLEATSEGDITFLISYSYSHSVVLTPVEYKINDGSWTAYASWPADAASITSSTGNWPVSFGDAIHVTAGDKVSFRGDNASYYGNGTGYECHITSTADVYVYGNMMSLVDADDFSTLATLTGDWNFAKLFKLPTVNLWDPPVTVTTIKSHPTYDIVLPATTLTNYCYNGLFAGCSGITRAPKLPATTMKIGCYAEMFRATSIVEAPALPTTVFQPYSYDAEGEHGSIDCYMQMFQDCTDLTVAPVLPATTLVHGVYQNMFEGCTSLTTAPALPATDLTGGDQCYTAMFKGCTSLVTAPALPATTLDNWCYMEMFSGCTSLVNAPELPATTLAEDCYHRMFEGCISLQKAPVLPAPTLLGQVYGGMFDGCTSLNYVKCLAVDIVDTSHGEDATTDCWLANVSATGTFIKADEADWSVKTKTGEAINGIPAGWTVKNASEEGGDFVAVETPLTFEAIEEATTVTIDNPLALTIQYSTNGGSTWTTASDATITISGISAGQTVQLRGDNEAYGTGSGYTNITFNKDCYVYGNMMSLINSTGFATAEELAKPYTFRTFFYNNKQMKSHPTKDLVLPATTLSARCYFSMFYGCNGLTRAPQLPATQLANYCYNQMFYGCNALTTAPALPATTLADHCYDNMFAHCYGLTQAPKLPATTMAEACYRAMFLRCEALKTAPELPATEMAKSCYLGMFYQSGLTAAPVLPATTLAMSCYYQMFQNCTGLTVAPALPATTLADGCYKMMFKGCANLTDVPTLTATTLGESSYEEMFKGCTALVNAPDLAATSLAATCCNYMFAGCSKLAKAPKLPATTLATQCYQRMFDGCTSLVTAPELPATNLAELCYNDMFWECTSLKNPPQLPATTLADYCYTMMFLGCTSLETAPVLPAATLTPGCYEHMFMNCSKLNYVKCLATDLGDDSSTDGWMTNVAATGTFVQAAGVDWSAKGTTEGTWGDPAVATTFVSGIPAGWTVKNVVALADDADNSTLLTTYQGAANDVTLSGRTLYRNGEWNTLCLPFDVASLVGTPLEGATIRPLTNAALTSTALTLTFGAAVNAITAGIPYIVKWTTTADNLTNPTFEDVTISSTTPSVTSFGTGNSQVQFIGTYGPETLVKDDPTNRYLGSGNKLYYPTVEGFKVNAFRAYFKLGALAASAPMVNLVIDETTSISDATRQNHQTNSAWYTLDGRQLTTKPMTKGVYIHNGKKEVVK